MAIYLNNINLNGNQLQKAVIHPLSTAPSTAAEGQVYYDLEDNVVYVNTSTNVNSPTWVNMQSGDLTGITADGGLTGTATSGAVTLAVGAGTGITVNADDVAVTAAQTGITSILNTSLTKIGTAGAQEYITFGTSNEVNTFVNNTERLSVTATGVDITGALTVSGSYNLASGDIPNNAADTSGTAANVTTNANLTGHITSSGNAAVLGSFTVAQLSTALSNASISGNNTGDQSASDVLTLIEDGVDSVHYKDGSIDTEHIADAQITMAKLANVATDTFIGRTAANAGVPKALSKAEALAILNVADGAQVNVAPTSAQVKSALNANLGTVTFGDSDDQINIPGNITVTGTTTMSGGTVINSTTNTAIKDTTIGLNTGIGAAENAADIGIIFDRGSLGNAFMGWDESEDEFIFSKTSSEPSDDVSAAAGGGIAIENDAAYLPLKVGSIELANGALNLAGHAMNDVDITSEASDADDHLMTALAIKNRIEDFGYTTNTGTTTAGNTQTFTNKSFNANGTGNAITNIDIGNMTAAVVQLSSESFSDNDTSFMTSAAINDRFALINANTTGTAAGLSATLAVASGGTGATNLNALVQTTGAQSIAGVKTFTSGLILDDGSGAAPIIKWVNGSDEQFAIFNNSSNKLIFQQESTTRMDLSSGGLDVVNGIKIGGSAVHPTDTTNTLGTSDTVVPSQNAVKTYVDAQTSGDSNTGGRQSFVLADATTGVAATSTTVFTITHGMGASRNYGVEIIRNSNNSGGGETVIVDVARPTDLTITVTFAVAPTAGDYTALVCKY